MSHSSGKIDDFVIGEITNVLKPGKLYQMTGHFGDMGQGRLFTLVKEPSPGKLGEIRSKFTNVITIEGQPWVMYLGASELGATNWVRVIYNDGVYFTSALNFEHFLVKNRILTKEYLRRYCVLLEDK